MKAPSPECGGLRSSFHAIYKRGLNWHHKNISNILHDHFCLNIIFDMVIGLHSTNLKSYLNLKVGALFLVT